jgi:hypothetical protein
MSSRVPPKLRAVAERLLAFEIAARKPADTAGSTAFRTCEKLREPLSKIVGPGGFRSLLSRALAVAGAEVSWLRALHIKADGSLEGLEELEANLDSRGIAEGAVVLSAQLLGLLITFIGPALTFRLLQDVWPKLNHLDL